VLRGSPDADGRATLRFESLLIRHDRVTAFSAQLARVVTAHWEKQAGRMTIRPGKDAARSTLHPAVISDAALAGQETRRFTCSSDSVSLRDVEAIVERCSMIPDFSLCYKSLNDRIPATINFVYGDSRARIVSRRQPERKMQPLPTPPPPAARSVTRGQTPLLVLLSVVVGVQTLLLIYIAINLPERQEIGETAQDTILKRFDWLQEKTSEGFHETRKELSQIYDEGANEHKRLLAVAGNDIKEVKDTLGNTRGAVEERIERAEETIQRQSKKTLDDLQEALQGRLDKVREEVIRRVKSMTPAGAQRQLGVIQNATETAITKCDKLDDKLIALEEAKNPRDRKELVTQVQSLLRDLRGVLKRIQEASEHEPTAPRQERSDEARGGKDQPENAP